MPNYQFEFDRLRTMDAEVALHVESVQTEKVLIRRVDLHLKLGDGVLVLDPIAFALQEGKLAGDVRVDGRETPAKVKLEGRLSGVQLEQFKGKSMNERPFSGVLTTRAQLEGRGNSVHDIVAGATGTVTAVVPHGEIRLAFAELTGINIARGLGLLIEGNNDRFAVRCCVCDHRSMYAARWANPPWMSMRQKTFRKRGLPQCLVPY